MLEISFVSGLDGSLIEFEDETVAEEFYDENSVDFSEGSSYEERSTTSKNDSWMEYFTYNPSSNKNKCKLCTKLISGTSKSNLKRHFCTLHPVEAREMNVELKRRKAPEKRPEKSAVERGNNIFKRIHEFFTYDKTEDTTECSLCNKKLAGKVSSKSHIKSEHADFADELRKSFSNKLKSAKYEKEGIKSCWMEYFSYNETSDRTECKLCKISLSGNVKQNNKRHFLTKHEEFAWELNVEFFRRSKSIKENIPTSIEESVLSSIKENCSTKDGSSSIKEIEKTKQPLDNTWMEYFVYNEAEGKTRCTLCDKQMRGYFVSNQKRHLLSMHGHTGKIDLDKNVH